MPFKNLLNCVSTVCVYAMKTNLPSFVLKNERRFLSVLVLPALLLFGAISQPVVAQVTPTAPCTLTDIDQDDDGLIEICDLEGLNAIRYQADGSGYRASASANKITSGCAYSYCGGYELVNDLDFNDEASYSSTSNKVLWTTGEGWWPIGDRYSYSPIIFEGNRHTISNLMINRSLDYVGLFGAATTGSEIVNIGLLDVNVTGRYAVAGLVGFLGDHSRITSSYVTGTVTGQYAVAGLVGFSGGNFRDYHSRITSSYVTGTVTGNNSVGGLIGVNEGDITNSYATGTVTGDYFVGGLAGDNGGDITNSYATGGIAGTGNVGGLVGKNRWGDITDSYWDMYTSGIATSDGGTSQTTVQLQSPTTATGIYREWNTSVWDFGTSEQYPALKYSDGTLIPYQFRVRPEVIPQMPQIEIVGVPAGAVNEGEQITLTVSVLNNESNIALDHRWTQTAGAYLLAGVTTGNRVVLDVPNDYVASATSSHLVLSIETSSDVGSIAHQIAITILRRNNGKVSVLGIPSLNDRELTAPTIDISDDPDGTGGNVNYQWQSRASTQTAWANVQTSADMKETYTIPETTRNGTQYRVVISYTDRQGYREEVISGAVVYEGSPDPQPEIISEITSCSLADIDQDNDGLIEICDLEGLNAMRYQLDGSGYRASDWANKITAGCADGGCLGYELVNDLDFNVADSYRDNIVDTTWTTSTGWVPIGSNSNRFSSVFEGNGHTIAHLYINRSNGDNIGLFAVTDATAQINNIKLSDVNVTGDDDTGSLVGENYGSIISIDVIGTVNGNLDTGGLVGENSGQITLCAANVMVTGALGSFASANIGGLVGFHRNGVISESSAIGNVVGAATVGGLLGVNWSRIVNTYAEGTVSGNTQVGGLVGFNFISRGGMITNSYAIGHLTGGGVIGSLVGGLVGAGINNSAVTASYWDTGTTGQESRGDFEAEFAKTTTELQSPTAPGTTPTEIYYGWSEEVWDFGTSQQYPALKYSDGTLIPRMPQIEIVGVPAGAVNEGEQITLTVSVLNNEGNIALDHRWTQTAGAYLLAGVTTGNRVVLDVPNDYVAVGVARDNLVLALEVSSDIGTTTHRVTITVAKHNNGGVAITDIPSLNIRELTAPSVDISADPDDGGSDIAYQWQTRASTQTAWVNVQTSADMKETYTIPDATRSGMQYRVVISYTDGQGYREEVVSDAVTYEVYIEPPLAPCILSDIDRDNDGLIEICDLEGLDAMRYQLDGSGYRASTLTTKTTAGCAINGCRGYELVNDLDFNDNASYRDPASKEIWTTGRGWQPIGDILSWPVIIFEGNSHTISNLMINRSSDYVGLFGVATTRSEIVNIGLLDVNVIGKREVAGLVGFVDDYSRITSSYVTGTVTGDYAVGGLVGTADEYSRITSSYAAGTVTGSSFTGGLAGISTGYITDSYATGIVTGDYYVGGLAGISTDYITNSYATGEVTGNSVYVGGLVGYDYLGRVARSYWDKETSGIATSDGGTGKTTTQLQSPTTATGIYSEWSTANWDFGTPTQYPALKYSDGTLMPNQPRERPEVIPQMPQIDIVGVPANAVNEGERMTLSAVAGSTANEVTLSYHWTQVSGKTLLEGRTTGESVTLYIPEDYIAVSVTRDNLVLALEVGSDIGTTTHRITITVAKHNNGGVAMTGVPDLNIRELTAPSVDINGDPDGGGNDIDYQWQTRASTQTAWANVQTSADMKETYTIPETTRNGTQYRVVISYTDGQGYREEMVSGEIVYEGSPDPQPEVITEITSCNLADIDQDDDGLIEICDLEGLNAMRYQLDGSGYRTSTLTTKITAGCADGGCKGYELTKSLSFAEDSDWPPIALFSGIFEGNGYTISKLTTNKPNANSVGFFSSITSGAKINNIGLLDIDIKGGYNVGGLVGYNKGDIMNSYATGAVTGGRDVGGLVGINFYGSITNSYATGKVAGTSDVGGLVGDNFYGSITNSYATGTVVGTGTYTSVGGLVGDNGGRITNSYATGAVTGGWDVGGLVGYNGYRGDITNSYATGSVSGLVGRNLYGGLVGDDFYGSITNSYWDKETSGITTSDGGAGKTTAQLQSPTIATGIYSEWSTANWDFGTSKQYPALKYSDGTLMPNQPRERPEAIPQMPQIDIVGVPANAVNEGDRITLSTVAGSTANGVTLSYHWTQVSGKTLLAEPTTTSSVTLDIPDNYVPSRARVSNIGLVLEVSSRIGNITRQISITVAKHNNGGVAMTGVPDLNIRELTAPSVDISGDPDGGGNDIDYQWQSRARAQSAWVNVQTSADMKETYTIPDATRSGTQYRVVISYTDGQGYREEIISGAVVYEGSPGPQPEIITEITSCSLADIDQDDDGLIEICDLEGLNAIRYQTDGSGYRANWSARKITAGCAGCRGYELVNDLDFNDEASYSSTSNKVLWTTGEGWWPIGDRYSHSPIIFEGNRHTISNLMINRSSDYVGLFGAATTGSEIVNIGLLDVNVTGNNSVGGLVGFSGDHSRITSSYVTGTVTGNNAVGGLVGVVDKYSRITSSYATGTVTGDYFVGGLVGNGGDITNSYATGTVTGDYNVGGLVGHLGGNITNSYAMGKVAGNNGVGGLVGRNFRRGRIARSYWDMYSSAIETSDGGTGKTTAQLQHPTAAGTTPTEVYYGWDEGVWDFGTSNQYPVLKYSDGTLIPYQRPEVIPQMPQIEIVGVPAGAVNEGERITLTAVVHSTSSSIPLNYHWVQTSGQTLLAAHTSTSSVTLDIPNNYVTSSTSVSNIELVLEVSSRMGSITRQISITVAKHNNGGVAMTGVPDLNIRELTAPSVDISGDPDGSGNNIDYQWQSRASAQSAWVNVQTLADMKVTYTIPDATRSGTQYRVVISYTDGQGYREEIISGAVVYEGSPDPQPEIISEITSCGLADIDQDDDGLIEICDIEGLDAMRYQLDGSGYRTSTLTTKITAGCAVNGCRGYELVKDLDFNDIASYSSTSNKVLWTAGEGWQPIGAIYSRPPIIFEGNRHTISNLMINRSSDYVGLFGFIATTGSEIVNIGLLDVNVTGNNYAGGLAGFVYSSRIANSYFTGTVTANNNAGGLAGIVYSSRIANSYFTGTVTANNHAGGLAGFVYGSRIANSYFTGTVTANNNAGGLAGFVSSSRIANSYFTGTVTGNYHVGGLVSFVYSSRITNSYWDKETSGITTSYGGEGKTTTQLQSPTAPGTTPTEIYYGWSEDIWYFGNSNQYPVLKYSDGTLIPYQRPEVIPQMPQIDIVGVPAGTVDEGERITLSAVVRNTSSIIPLNYHWVQTLGQTLLAEPTTTSSVTLDIPDNYVPSRARVSNIRLVLEVSSRIGSITRQISITVAKHNNGSVVIAGVPSLNIRELTAPSVDISGDPDGGGNNIDYQWQSRTSAQSAWVNVQTLADMKVTYTIPDATRSGTQYRVVISYADGQGYREEVISGAVVYEGSPGPQPEIISETTSCGLADIDQDNDGLIEICDLEGLNSIRYQLDGSGYRAASTVTAKITAGCADDGCRGYELVNDLDFNDIASYSSTANKVLWTTGAGWQPLGTFSDPFNAVFDANKYTISNLMINRPDSDNVGLFSRIGRQARIIGIGLIGVDISGDWGVGSVVGYSDGEVLNSYAIGTVWGSYSTGGLVGDNYNAITNSYTNVAVSGSDYIGGIVGCNFGGGDVINSYTISSISSIESYRGGVLGWNTTGRVINSYWNTDTSGVMNNHYGEGLTTVQLQTPTDAGSNPTDIYYGWDESVWDFGTSKQYPVLKYRDGTLMPDKKREEIAEILPRPRLPQIEIVGVPAGAVNEGERITLTAVFRSTSSNSIPLNYHWTQTSGKTVLAAHTSTSSVTLDIPDNYVTSSTSVNNIELALAVSGRMGSITRQISITVAKHNNGSSVIAGVPSLNIRELTAPVVDLSYDPDGGGSNITYQWQARASAQSAWVNVQTLADMKVTYTIPDATRSGTQYRVVISYTDGQGYREEVISGAVVYEGSPGPQLEITSCSLADIDQDNDGLIEICDVEGLNAIRYQLDGSGYRAASTVTAKITAGCADGGCRGYELVNDLDFNDIASYSSTANKVLWTTGAGWQPLGTFSDPFNAVFDANKYTISNLMINRPDSDNVGLFSRIGSQARIVGIGLIGVDISGDWGVGSVVGYSDGVVLNSYAIGTVWGSYSIGGLVGDNYNAITNSYTNVAVSGSDYIGGIVGCNFGGGDVINSYTISSISSIESYRGGVLGWNTTGRVINSYWNTDTSGFMNNHYGEGLTTVQLQTPTNAGSNPTDIYYGWDESVWDFGTSKQYPVLKYRDGTLVSDKRREETTEILPRPRLPQVEIVGVPAGAVNEGERITLTAVFRSTSSSSIPLNYHWTQTSGQTLLAGHTSTSSVTLDIPDNYVTSSTNVSNIELALAVGSRMGSITRQISITVAKHNNGSSVIAGIPSLNIRELIAPVVDLSYDPDGSGSNITYQWQSRTSTQTAWANVQTPADTKATYTIPEATRNGTQYRVVINYIDGQGYHEQVISLVIVYEGSSNPQPEIITEITSCSLVDLDQDNDGLIEICNLEGLNAMRYQLDGSGYRTNTSMAKITTGCAVGGCKGYELANDLDFNDNASYRDTTNKELWTTGKGWQPIGTENKAFAAVFNGNNYTISNLMINTTMNQVGLFGVVTFHEITKVGLLDVDIMGGRQVGGLAGRIYGSNITDSYVIGSVAGDAMVGGLIGAGSRSHITNSYAIGRVKGEYVVGGLVGSIREDDSIINSYAATSVLGNNYIGGFVGQNRGGKIINSYAVGSIEGGMIQNHVAGLIAINSGTVIGSYWDRTVKAEGNDGEGRTTEQLRQPTAAGSTSTEVYYGWDEDVWDFGTSTQYPALKYSDGTLMPHQRFGLLDLSILEESAKLSLDFNGHVFDYRLLIGDEVDVIRLMSTATHTSATIDMTSNSGFNGYVESGFASAVIPLNATATTVIMIRVELMYATARTYRIIISRSIEQDPPVGVATAGEFFEYTVPQDMLMDDDGSMVDYEVMYLPDWMQWVESGGTIRFSGMPQVGYMDDPSKHTIGVKIDNSGGASRMINFKVQIDSPTVGTIRLMETPGGILQVNDQLSDANGILERIYVWEHCPAGASAFTELIGVNGVSYELPASGPSVEPGTAYRVTATVVDGLGQRSEHATQIELRDSDQKVIKVRVKVFLESLLR